MKKSVKIPKELYVTAKEQSTYDYETNTSSKTIPLGFLNGYDKTKPSEKKHLTQNKWAYVAYQYVSGVVSKQDDHYVITGETYESQGLHRGRVPFTKIIDKELEPRIWDNEPLAGFKILTSVTRHSTSNKVWRVLDPRGLQFEISTASFEMIVMNADIHKGVIMAPCIWAGNKNLIIAE